MNILLAFLGSFSFLLLLSCTNNIGIDISPDFSGKIQTFSNKSIDSAKVEIIAIDDIGHASIETFIGKIFFTDTTGYYRLVLPGGVEYEESNINGKKKYTRYIKSATIKVSKEQFRDTIVTLYNTNYEESHVEKNIVLTAE